MKLFFLIICVVPLIYAQDPCAAFSANCTLCTSAAEGCGWCATTLQCMQGDAVTGPKNGVCLGQAWQFGVASCARCSLLQNCRQCNMHPADCGWCDKNKACQPLSSFGNLGSCTKLENCPCDGFGSCDTCLDDSNCHWCEKEARCQNINVDCPNNGPAFNVTVGCPCDYNRNCFSCKEAYNCQWCNNLGTCQAKGTPSNGTTPCLISTGASCDPYCKTYGNSSCRACAALNGCAWCTADNACVDDSYAKCMTAHTCETCSDHLYCDPCMDNPSCVWCGGNEQVCKAKSDPRTCPTVLTCEDMCSRFSSCTTCNSGRGCGWCPSDPTNTRAGKCMDVDKSKGKCDTLIAHSCDPTPISPPQKCGFDGGSFVGGMFLVIGVIVVGGVAYLFYRWKTGRKILYTELR